MKHSAVQSRAGVDLSDARVQSDSTRLHVKRLIDVTAAALGLLLLAPLLAVLGLLIRLDSPGPMLFGQTRVGMRGRRFRIWKLRTMHVGTSDEIHRALVATLMGAKAASAAAGPASPVRDARVTRVGQWLRRTSLDELPQLINVLRGEMSLVGPRPVTEYELELYEPWQLTRLQMPQGMTGLYQVSGRNAVATLLERGAGRALPRLGVGYQRMLELDVAYVRGWSLALDFRILIRTIPTVLRLRSRQ